MRSADDFGLAPTGTSVFVDHVSVVALFALISLEDTVAAVGCAHEAAGHAAAVAAVVRAVVACFVGSDHSVAADRSTS